MRCGYSTSNGLEIINAQFPTLARLRGEPFLHSRDFRVRHFCLREDFGAKIIVIASVVRDNQAVRFLISHVTSP
jgi:hypothetical protein